MSTTTKLLELSGLCTEFPTVNGPVKAVNHLDLTINRGEVMALVGESGSGKSVTAMSVMGLIRQPGRVTSGKILFNGEDLTTYNERQWQTIRGNRIAMIFQEPMTSLNPLFTVGDQITESLRKHKKMSKKEALGRAQELLELVRISEPAKRLNEYPHRLSGGMRQRVMIAMALACDPELLIADEPTTALDVTVQAQIMDLIGDLRKELGMTILLITHDLGVVAQYTDRVAVMYAGKKVEEADVYSIFETPQHPYTQGLLASITHKGVQGKRLYEIPGRVPPLNALPPGCAFAPRCSFATDACQAGVPELRAFAGQTRSVACINAKLDEI
ncbi:ABC transporter ATP-binding protein [Sneathiella sp.]|mgnify:CR=1 FL=1|uniref:ABC transporter ATP-binding protein n=1 Tax=Sneathiella sp. TaxID=1964365 RepID=UPI002FE261EC